MVWCRLWSNQSRTAITCWGKCIIYYKTILRLVTIIFKHYSKVEKCNHMLYSVIKTKFMLVGKMKKKRKLTIFTENPFIYEHDLKVLRVVFSYSNNLLLLTQSCMTTAWGPFTACSDPCFLPSVLIHHGTSHLSRPSPPPCPTLWQLPSVRTESNPPARSLSPRLQRGCSLNHCAHHVLMLGSCNFLQNVGFLTLSVHFFIKHF